MTEKRRRLSPKVLEKEKLLIIQFTFNHVGPSHGAKLFISTVFDAYKQWRLTQGLGETELSVDGFGRLFDKSFLRKAINIGGKVKQGVLDIALYT